MAFTKEDIHRIVVKQREYFLTNETLSVKFRKTQLKVLKKAILEGVAAVLLIFGAIILLNVDKFWIENAKHVTGSYTNYYETYLLPAINGELYFGKDYFPDVTFAVCLGVGIVKAINCGLLLFQKFYARKVNRQSVQVSE